MSTDPKQKARILVIEDDRSLREGLAMNLRMAGYDVVTASDGETGMNEAFKAGSDLLIVDIMMPCWSGLEIIEELRKRGIGVPVLVLSAKGRLSDKVTGLNVGADDYMTKPFDLPELMARVEAMLRRGKADTNALPDVVAAGITISPTSHVVTVDGKPIELSAKEFDILLLMAKTPGQVFSRDTILERVWGWDYEGTARTVDNFVVRLRKKLEGSGKKYIKTVPKLGYKFDI